MKNPCFGLSLHCFCLGFLVLTGCSRPPQTLTPDKVPAAMNQAFGQASGETKDTADQAVAAFQQNNPVVAFNSLQSLANSRGLTPEQRSTAAQALLVATRQLRQASDQGDKEAQTTLNHFMLTK